MTIKTIKLRGGPAHRTAVAVDASAREYRLIQLLTPSPVNRRIHAPKKPSETKELIYRESLDDPNRFDFVYPVNQKGA